MQLSLQNSLVSSSPAAAAIASGSSGDAFESYPEQDPIVGALFFGTNIGAWIFAPQGPLGGDSFDSYADQDPVGALANGTAIGPWILATG